MKPEEEKLLMLGEGEWMEEPDVYLFSYLKFNCSLKRSMVGVWCGYVEIPADHPYYKKKYEDILINVHGGLTFNEFIEPDNKHLIGFDCAHLYDLIPSYEYLKKTNQRMIDFDKKFPLTKIYEDFSLFKPVYRNIDFCIQECKSIVNQLIDLNSEEKNETMV